MSIRFRGGERLQRGRGIGGLLRLVKSVFSPLVKSFGRTALKAATSKTGQKAIASIKEQALSSAANMTADAIRGNDLSESLQKEVSAARQTMGNTVQNLTGRKNNPKVQNHPKSKIKNTYGIACQEKLKSLIFTLAICPWLCIHMKSHQKKFQDL